MQTSSIAVAIQAWRVHQMNKKKKMCEFVFGGCKPAKEPEWFVPVWLKTKGNPCSVCETDKSKCSFYKELVAKGTIDEEENPS